MLHLIMHQECMLRKQVKSSASCVKSLLVVYSRMPWPLFYWIDNFPFQCNKRILSNEQNNQCGFNFFYPHYTESCHLAIVKPGQMNACDY